MRLPRPAGATALLRAAVLLAVAAALPRALAVKGISPWQGGLITHFGGAQDSELGAGVAAPPGR